MRFRGYGEGLMSDYHPQIRDVKMSHPTMSHRY